MPIPSPRRTRRGSIARTGEPAARAPRPGCWGRKWRRDRNGFLAEKARRPRSAAGRSRLCLWRKMSLRSGLPKWSLVSSSLLFPCLRVETISSGFDSGGTFHFLCFQAILKVLICLRVNKMLTFEWVFWVNLSWVILNCRFAIRFRCYGDILLP